MSRETILERWDIYYKSKISSLSSKICKHVIKIILCVLMVIAFSKCVKAENADINNIEALSNIKIIINKAERKYNIPTGLLAAIAASESNFYIYIIGIEGKAIYCESLYDAKNYVLAITNSGLTNLDIGIMQINWYWHKERFASIEEMFSPKKNINYAAKFLLDLKRQYGSWEQAVRYYNSSNPKFNEKYYEKVIYNWIRINK